MAEGFVIFDLAALHGTARYVPGGTLPRHDKASLELLVARTVLHIVAQWEDPAPSAPVNNPDDPPDVFFQLGEQRVGMEIAELLPENRLGRDAVISQTKQTILNQLTLGPATRDWVVTIVLLDDYAVRLKLRAVAELGQAIANHLTIAQSNRQPAHVAIPPTFADTVRLIRAEPWDLSDDPRIGVREEPLIIFSAQHTNVVPDRDFPALMESVIGRKARHSVVNPTWLVLWSNHYGFAPLREHLVRHIDQYVQSHSLPYARVFYLHGHGEPTVTEITRDSPAASPPHRGA